MTGQTIPADAVREIAEKMHYHANQNNVRGSEEEYVRFFARQLDELLPPPPRPTLADMTREERRACAWMQADVWPVGRAVITFPDSGNEPATLIDRQGKVIYAGSNTVTPRPDLPRMEWPGDQKAALEETPESEEEFMANIEKALDDHYGPLPAPALPDGWRLADHPSNGRVIVTNPTPNIEGRVYYVLPSADPLGFDWLFCDPDDLTYLDTDQEVEDVTPVKAGDVIESADDPRLDALPIGSILLDRDGEAVTKRREEWEGGGRIPIPYEGEVFGPWTVLHIPKKADQ